jgi:signal transduction histidine kinase
VREFDQEEREFMQALADQCAQALDRARLYEAERLARTEAERLRAVAEEAQAAAERARRGADEANRAKSEFLATMSHEIRTPINAIVGYTQLLDLGIAGPVTEQQRDYLARLAASSHHLRTLVDDVLDLAKIDAGGMTVDREPALTGSAVAAAMDLLRPQATEKGVRLVDGRPGEPGEPYLGDEDRVRQILVNLLSNAVKFTAPGGTVTVTCGSAAQGAPGSAFRGGPWTFVRVEDTGVGIAPEQQTAIFEPFVQAEGGLRRTAGGTGLGLAISRRLARMMGGDLTVESRPGVGSTFTLWLPAGATSGTGARGGGADDAGEPGRRGASALRLRGVRHVGEALRASIDLILATYTERLRADPMTPVARRMRQAQVEDHQVTLLADLAQSLVTIDDAGDEAPSLLRDGTAIQRTVADHHGARRHAQGWTEAAVRRDHQVLREVVESVVRARVAETGDDAGAADALAVLAGMIEHVEAVSVRAWRRAAQSGAVGPL